MHVVKWPWASKTRDVSCREQTIPLAFARTRRAPCAQAMSFSRTGMGDAVVVETEAHVGRLAGVDHQAFGHRVVMRGQAHQAFGCSAWPA